MKQVKMFVSLLGVMLFTLHSAHPCTTFVLQGGGRLYFGRNLDWDWEDGLVILNQRNVSKTAFVMPNRTPAKWTSKYGSVTFNQFGQEMPFGGMNEAGLVVENMMLDESQYPAPDARPEIGRLQWVQYQLDNCRTVAEVIATDGKIRQEQPLTPGRIHYLVCDATGDCATIEWLGGKMVCHRGADLPYRALANSTYEESVAYTRTNGLPAGSATRSNDKRSLARFACAAARAAAFQPRDPETDLAYAFDTLEQVRQGKYTVWQMVYDISGRKIHYRTGTNPRQQTLDLTKLDFACARPVKFADLRATVSPGEVLALQDLSEEQHRKYLQTFMAQESLKRGLGDLSLLLEPMLLTVRGYSCAGQ
jgi:penicillin V acylase-like amidase (Ntn superfamily)